MKIQLSMNRWFCRSQPFSSIGPGGKESRLHPSRLFCWNPLVSVIECEEGSRAFFNLIEGRGMVPFLGNLGTGKFNCKRVNCQSFPALFYGVKVKVVKRTSTSQVAHHREHRGLYGFPKRLKTFCFNFEIGSLDAWIRSFDAFTIIWGLWAVFKASSDCKSFILPKKCCLQRSRSMTSTIMKLNSNSNFRLQQTIMTHRLYNFMSCRPMRAIPVKL